MTQTKTHPLTPASHKRALRGFWSIGTWHGRGGSRDVFLFAPSSSGDVWSAHFQRGKPLPPGSPAATRVSTDPATGQRVVAWPYVWGATSYEIWRSGARLGTTRQTRFVDTTAIAGSSYTYSVRAVNKAGRSPFGPTGTG